MDRAKLTPQDYNGPRKRINFIFRATREIYRVNGALCLRMKKITQIDN